MGLLSWLISAVNSEKRILNEHVQLLIDQAVVFGLPDQDVANAAELLEYNEFELAFDSLVEQLYEYSISINAEYYQLVKTSAEKMKLPEQSFIFLKELIK